MRNIKGSVHICLSQEELIEALRLWLNERTFFGGDVVAIHDVELVEESVLRPLSFTVYPLESANAQGNAGRSNVSRLDEARLQQSERGPDRPI